MMTLTVTSKGQITLNKDLLRHLGVTPGGKVEVEVLPGGQLVIKAAGDKGRWEDVFGLLAGKTDKIAKVEETNEAIRDGWAGLK